MICNASRAAVAAVLVLLVSGAAFGQDRCDSRARLVAQLAERFQEAPIALGVDSRGRLVEVLAAADGSTWTILVTSPRGQSCMVAAGEGWRSQPRKDHEPGA